MDLWGQPLLVPIPRQSDDREVVTARPVTPGGTSSSVPRPLRIQISPAERLVLVELTRDGACNRVIANRLGLTEDTIKTHIRRVMSRCPLVKDRTALAVALLRRAITTEVVRQPGTRGPRRQA